MGCDNDNHVGELRVVRVFVQDKVFPLLLDLLLRLDFSVLNLTPIWISVLSIATSKKSLCSLCSSHRLSNGGSGSLPSCKEISRKGVPSGADALFRSRHRMQKW